MHIILALILSLQLTPDLAAARPIQSACEALFEMDSPEANLVSHFFDVARKARGNKVLAPAQFTLVAPLMLGGETIEKILGPDETFSFAQLGRAEIDFRAHSREVTKENLSQYLAKYFGDLQVFPNKPELISMRGLAFLIIDGVLHQSDYESRGFDLEKIFSNVSPLAGEFYRSLRDSDLLNTDKPTIPNWLAYEIQTEISLSRAVRKSVGYLRDLQADGYTKFQTWNLIVRELKRYVGGFSFGSVDAYTRDEDGEHAYVAFGLGGYVLVFLKDGRILKGLQSDLHSRMAGQFVTIDFKRVTEVPKGN